MATKSIMQTEKECYICREIYGMYNPNNLEMHHCIKGTANRQWSEAMGLKVWLCWTHHRGTEGVHGRDGHNIDRFLQKKAQETAMLNGLSLSQWMKVFNKNYLGE